MIRHQIFLMCIVAGILATMLFSCGNSMKNIAEVAVKDTFPVEQAKNITMYYSDSGKIEACLKAPVMKRYEDKDRQGILKLTSGVKVVFYDSLGKEESVLTAKYGERNDKLQRIDVKYDVVVLTSDSTQLYSEHLIWEEKQDRIHSDVFVKIVTPDKIIWGDGFESDERFENYKILRPKGEFQIKDDKKAEQ